MEEAPITKDNNREAAPALIAVDPQDTFVVVAIGFELRVFDLRGDLPVAIADDPNGHRHSDAIRAICFDVKGKFFVSAGDDKLVKVWRVDSWQCIRTVCSEKRVSAVAISPSGLHICFADRFGVVWVVDMEENVSSNALNDKKGSSFFGHYCSIITSLDFSPDGKFIASADRDFKIRVTSFPSRPLLGAHEIQSFCLGHRDFVSCLTFVHPEDCPHGFLVSGGGDSTVRFWDLFSGFLLDTCELGAKLDTRAGEAYGAVTNLCALKDGSLIAVAIQSLQGVVLLYCDFSAKLLSIAQVVPIGENFIPTSLATSYSAKHLWMVMGASSIESSSIANLTVARIKVIAGLDRTSDSHSPNMVVLEDRDLPGGTRLLETLQGSADVEKHAASLSNVTETLKIAMRTLLIKKQYCEEKREHRKRGRNDKKV